MAYIVCTGKFSRNTKQMRWRKRKLKGKKRKRKKEKKRKDETLGNNRGIIVAAQKMQETINRDNSRSIQQKKTIKQKIKYGHSCCTGRHDWWAWCGLESREENFSFLKGYLSVNLGWDTNTWPTAALQRPRVPIKRLSKERQLERKARLRPRCGGRSLCWESVGAKNRRRRDFERKESNLINLTRIEKIEKIAYAVCTLQRFPVRCSAWYCSNTIGKVFK